MDCRIARTLNPLQLECAHEHAGGILFGSLPANASESSCRCKVSAQRAFCWCRPAITSNRETVAAGVPLPSDGTAADGVRLPSDGTAAAGVPLPGDGTPAAGVRLPSDGTAADGAPLPGDGTSAAGVPLSSDGTAANGAPLPSDGTAAAGVPLSSDGTAADGARLPSDGTAADGVRLPSDGTAADGAPPFDDKLRGCPRVSSAVHDVHRRFALSTAGTAGVHRHGPIAAGL
eukprot:365249-Chlamydomonas_euryale.AAC.27